MAIVRQHSLRENYFTIPNLALGTSAATLTRWAIPKSGFIKRISAVAHGGGVDVDVDMSFAIGAVSMVDAAGVDAILTLAAADVAGSVSTIEFPDVLKNRVLEAEGGDTVAAKSVFLVVTDGANGPGTETYSFNITIEQ